MTTKHTPGPWKAGQWGEEYIVKGPQGERVFSITNGVIPMNADAALIAAAPELLAELKARVSDARCPKHYTMGEWRSKNAPAHILITRIEGES